jgi:hypothetical protein
MVEGLSLYRDEGLEACMPPQFREALGRQTYARDLPVETKAPFEFNPCPVNDNVEGTDVIAGRGVMTVKVRPDFYINHVQLANLGAGYHLMAQDFYFGRLTQ